MFASTVGVQAQSPRGDTGSRPKSEISTGRQLFSSNCAGCHGLDGRGGERAPNIAKGRETLRLSDEELVRTIRDGMPGMGMPAFRSLGTTKITAIAEYVRVLQGVHNSAPVRGDPQQGKTIFFGEAKCSDCHMVAGEGGFLGIDLSSYARTHNTDEIHKAITEPPLQNRSVVAVTRNGERFAGIVRNEDNFSVQVQAVDGSFHFLMKSELENLEFQSQSLMPADYGTKLNSRELDDLISFLVESAKSAKSTDAPAKKEEE
ncbi:MAG TPA: c-type cytochrome [Terriglobales bacterium]